MKKILFLFLAFICIQPAYAIEEVVLDVDDNLSILDKNELEDVDDKWEFENTTLYEKIQNIRAKEYKDTKKSHYLLEEITTKNFDKGPIETAHVFGYYRGAVNFNIMDSGNDWGYDFNDINAGVNGKFRDGKTYYEARLQFKPQSDYTFMQFLPSNLYIATTAIPHHTFILGNTRTPNGYEGGMSTTYIPFVVRSQIARNFGNVRKVGARVKGKYSLVEYDLGAYSSDTYFREFFPGAEFSGWLTLRPLGKTDGRYGKLKLGGGVTAGNRETDYCVSGLYAEYEYKKFMANFEYAKADGYNSARGISTNKAEGFYSTAGYKITPKLQLLARYDYYVPNKNIANDVRREYSAGINYFIKGQALKLMLNYVFCQNDLIKDSHRIILGTQVLL